MVNVRKEENNGGKEMIEFIVDEFKIEYLDGFAVKMLDTFSGANTEIRLSTLREIIRKLDDEVMKDHKTGVSCG